MGKKLLAPCIGFHCYERVTCNLNISTASVTVAASGGGNPGANAIVLSEYYF